MHRDLPPQPARLSVIARIVTLVATSFALLATVSVSAQADELDRRREQLDRELVEQQQVVEHYSRELQEAIAALEAAEGELREAERELAAAEAATEEARRIEEEKKAEEYQAQRDLQRAEAAVAAAIAAWNSVDHRVVEEITVITQQSGPLVNLAMLFSDVSMANLNQRAQLSSTLFDYSALELDKLTERRFQMEQAEAAAEVARQAAEDARRAAEEQTAEAEAAEAAAEQLRASVADKVAARDAAKSASESALAGEQQRHADLEAESADVDRRIQERIRKQEEERLRREAEERRKQEEAEKARQAELARQQRENDRKAAAAKQKNNSSNSSSSGSTSSSSSGSSGASSGSSSSSSSKKSSSGFIRPVPGRITSPYGPRVHPILGVRRLHDGTDFAGACGSPIKAAASGTVAERYYHSAYGHRLMIDHGRIDGRYVTTGYNHATRYIVSVGQRVSQGQTIGYVGTTGYSTGCHLHLMVWDNGSVVNPMAKWFR